MTKICAISDTHSLHNEIVLPEADILVFAGDITNVGELQDIRDFNAWLGEQRRLGKFHTAIGCAGNHDFAFEDDRREEAERALFNCIYLRDSMAIVDGISFYGSPSTPAFGGWAFNLPRDGQALKMTWDLIPNDTEILITHGPPYGIMDKVPRGELTGCKHLLNRVKKVKPLFHFFGHIHCGYGTIKRYDTTFVNASICDEMYEPVGPPIVVEI